MKLRGEWWIMDGQVEFADGDVSDADHMTHVLDHVSGQFLDALREHVEFRQLVWELRWLEDSYDLPQLCETINNWADAEMTAGRLTEEQVENIYTVVCEKIGWDEEKFELLIGHSVEGEKDPRNYAIKHLGWIKVAKNTVACWVLDFSTLKRISNGFDSILEEETLNSADVLLDITTHSDGRLFDDVPLPLIDGAELETILRRHRRGASTDTTIQPGPESIA
jgi:hypothetical protein